MDDLQLHMAVAQRNHDEASRLHNEFMRNAAEQHRQHQHEDEVSDAEMDKLEKEFQEWMTYIKNKKLD